MTMQQDSEQPTIEPDDVVTPESDEAVEHDELDEDDDDLDDESDEDEDDDGEADGDADDA